MGGLCGSPFYDAGKYGARGRNEKKLGAGKKSEREVSRGVKTPDGSLAATQEPCGGVT